MKFQDGKKTTSFSVENIVPGQEYEIAAVFSADGVKLFVDGVLFGSDSERIMSWETNQEYLQIGGLGSGGSPGSDSFRDAFSGQIADFQIYDEALTTDQLELLAQTSSFDAVS